MSNIWNEDPTIAWKEHHTTIVARKKTTPPLVAMAVRMLPKKQADAVRKRRSSTYDYDRIPDGEIEEEVTVDCPPRSKSTTL